MGALAFAAFAPSAHAQSGANGNGPLGDTLNNSDGGIGYGDTATARSKGFDVTPNTGDTTFWVPLTDGDGDLAEPTTDPQSHTNGVRGSNCDTVTFKTLDASPFPATTLDSWAQVTGVGSNDGYPTCTLTYDIAFDDYEDVYGNSTAEADKARTVKAFLKSMVSTQGQNGLDARDYGALPTGGSNDILAKAVAGANAIKFNGASATAPDANFQSGCTGSAITGRGASFQASAKTWFIQNFRTSIFCGASGPNATYEPLGSGAGRAAMGERRTSTPNANPLQVRDPNIRLGSTDEPPTASQEGQMENGPCTPTTVAPPDRCDSGDPDATDTDDSPIHVIPVATGSIPLIVNYPNGCTIPAGSQHDPGAADQTTRMKATNALWEDAWAGDNDVDTWGELAPGIDEAAGSSRPDGSCASAPIKRVVRFDSSGTTFAFKDWLNSVNPGRGWRGALANQDWPNNTGEKTVRRGGTPGDPPPPPPDSDGDGKPDASDACPDQAAATDNGCPVSTPTDTDGDGVPDSSDACPNVPGPQPAGCPPAEIPGPPSNNLTLGSLKGNSSKINVPVTVPGGGKIDVSATSNLPSSKRVVVAKTKSIGKASRTVSAAGTYTLTIKLSKAAKRALKRKKLKAKVKTTFTPTGGTPGSRTKTVTLKKAR